MSGLWLKKLRATLKLVRPVLGDDWYRRENERFRGSGQALSNVRDAQVRAQTVEALAVRWRRPAARRLVGGSCCARRRGTSDNGELESFA